MGKSPQQEVFKKINQAKTDELKKVLLNLSALHPQMAQMILAVFNNQPVDLEVKTDEQDQYDFPQNERVTSEELQVDEKAIESEIRHIRGVISNEIRIGNESGWTYSEIQHLNHFFLDFLTEIIGPTGHAEVPFQLGFPSLLIIIKNLMVVYRDNTYENNDILQTIEETFDGLEEFVFQYAGRLNVKLQKKYLKQALKLFGSNAFQGYDNLRYEFIESIHEMITRDVADEVIAASDKLVKNADFWDNGDRKTQHIILRIMIAVQTGQIGLAKEIATANMDIDDIRQQWVSFLESQENFDEAEKILLEAPRNNAWQKERWDDSLTGLYVMSDQKAKVIPLLRKRVLSHQTNAYELYKNIMIDDNLWEKIYPNFLKEMEKKLTRYEFGDILVTEKEYSKLLDQLKKYNSAPMIRKYLPELYPHRKKEVAALYYDKVVVPESKKDSANAPRQLRKDLDDFFEVSGDGKLVQRWIKQLQLQLADKPEFLEFLSLATRNIEMSKKDY